MWPTYIFKQISNVWYVIHQETGMSLVYHWRRAKYTEEELVHWKMETGCFDAWFNFTNRERQKMKSMSNSLDCCNQSSPIQEKDLKIMEGLGIYSPKKKTTRNDDMYVSQDVTVTEKNDASQTKSYFLRRIQDIECDKTREAYKTYGFAGLSRDMTPNELIARIKSDAFTLETDEADEAHYDVLNFFTWTTVKKDRKGYEAFQRGLADLVASTKDAIWAETDFSKLPGLVAAFKAATVTPVTLN